MAKSKSLGFGIALGALVAGLSGCVLGPDFSRPKPPAASDYGSAPLSGETSAALASAGNAQRYVAEMDIPGQWWTLFRSPKLDGLVDQALKANPNVDSAKAALRQAHELVPA